MLTFHASKVTVSKDDDAECIVGCYGQNEAGKLRYLELQLFIKKTRGVYDFYVRVEVGRPRRVDKDCIASAALKKGSFRLTFKRGSKLAGIGKVEITFASKGREYQQFKQALQEVLHQLETFKIG